MHQRRFGRFAADMERLGAAGVGAPELELGRDVKYLLRYIPFEHVSTQAKLVIVGITPGPTQLGLAYQAVRDLRQAHWSEAEILQEVKKIGAFGGASMKPNLLKMLNHFGFAEILGIQDVGSLWDEHADLLHATSVVPHAAFKLSDGREQMFAGSFDEAMKSSLLRACFMEDFVCSLRDINPDAIYVGLGRCPESALQWCVERGYLREQQVLGAFCHPSTSGGSTTAYYLREVTKAQLSPKNPVRKRTAWLDRAYEQMWTNTRALLGESRVGRPERVQADGDTAPSESCAPASDPVQAKPKKARQKVPEPLPAGTSTLYAEFQKCGFELSKETEKVAEFEGPRGQIVYLVKTSSRRNGINLMVHPDLKPESLRRLEGVEGVSDEHRFHSNMTRFPKRHHKGQTETAYAWQVGIDSVVSLPKFLDDFVAITV